LNASHRVALAQARNQGRQPGNCPPENINRLRPFHSVFRADPRFSKTESISFYKIVVTDK